MSSVLLRGGTVIDGTGRPGFEADLAIVDGRIADIGPLTDSGASLVLDVRGLVVSPGFIDPHSHAEAALLSDPLATPKVAQGVTTEVVNNCGSGLFPVTDPVGREAATWGWGGEETPTFRCVGEYRVAIMRQGVAVNVAALLPHGVLRAGVMGLAGRPATPEEIEAMCQLARRELQAGVAGISFGLLYAPACFATREELTALGRVAADFGRPLAFHVRNECDRFEESVAEAIAVGADSGAPVHISHLKVADPAHWGEVGRALRLMEQAVGRNQWVTCDQYPYTAGSSPFTTLLPPWALEGGKERILARLRDPVARRRLASALAGKEEIRGWDNLARRIGWERCVVGSAPGAEEWEGRSIDDLARQQGEDPAEVVFVLLERTRGAAVGIWHQMSEEDVQTVMRHPAQMVGSDGLHVSGKPHPRLWGTFPRVLGRYVRELGVLSLEEAIHKMTARPARRFGLAGRGTLEVGSWADVCVFDPTAVADRATWEEPTLPPIGLVHVFCNGSPTLLYGERTRNKPGRWLP